MNDITPDFEGIRNLAAIVDGMPDAAVNLSSIASNERMHPCGTTACALGVVCLHPDFKHKGARYRHPLVQLDGELHHEFAYDYVGAVVFGISLNDARLLFSPNRGALPDKSEFKNRVINFLRSHGQPISEAYINC